MKFLLVLYPAAWRKRYEDEFLAVLEERPLSPFDVVDIALGALDVRLHPRDLAIEFVGRRSFVMMHDSPAGPLWPVASSPC